MRAYFLWLAKLITLVIVFFVVIPMVVGVGAAMVHSVSAQRSKLLSNSDHKVAVVELKGEIEDAREIVEELHERAEDKTIKGIVLVIDSPGGAVAPSQDIYDAVRTLKAKKPIVVSMGSVAASGGFYAAAAASKIFAQPGTLTGSIGVIMQIPNFKKVAALVGVDMVTIKSGKMKDIGNSFRDMTPEEQQFLETTAATIHEGFINAVAQGRSIPREKLLEFADGRVIVGSDAVKLGLVDTLGDRYAAAQAVFELLNDKLPPTELPELIYKDDGMSELKKMLKGVRSCVSWLSQTGVSVKFLMP